MVRFRGSALVAVCAIGAVSCANANEAGRARYADAMRELSIKHDVPERLIHRIIMRESRYHPHLVAHGNYGLMQIKPATARGMGYRGAPSGLLDGRTNLTYAVPYLANAYRIAGRNEDAAVRLYAGGYYYVARRKGLLGQLQTAHAPQAAGQAREDEAPQTVTAYAPAPAEQSGLLSFLFSGSQPAPQPVAVAEAEQALEASDEPAPDLRPAPLPPRRPARLAARD